MKISQCMSKDVKWINTNKTAQDAAKLMRENNIGSIPVEENEKFVGIVTDRDLALHILAEGKSLDSNVKDCMTKGIKYCFEDESVKEVASQMGELKIRRMPVMNRDKKLVGIVSLADIATEPSCQQEAIKAFSQMAL